VQLSRLVHDSSFIPKISRSAFNGDMSRDPGPGRGSLAELATVGQATNDGMV